MSWCFTLVQDDVEPSHDQPPTTWPNMACNSEDSYDDVEDSDEDDIVVSDSKTSLGQVGCFHLNAYCLLTPSRGVPDFDPDFSIVIFHHRNALEWN